MFAAPAAAETSYFRLISDLPLAPGLSEDGAAFDFDSDQGRMIGATAHGAGELASVRDFYLETLPQLGWALVPMSPDLRGGGGEILRFQRGRESLVLEIDARGTELALDVRLVAQPASMNAH